MASDNGGQGKQFIVLLLNDFLHINFLLIRDNNNSSNLVIN